ncbi:unnamed protein product [Arctogadus glacialis]
MSEAVPAALSGPYDGALGGALTLRPGPRCGRDAAAGPEMLTVSQSAGGGGGVLHCRACLYIPWPHTRVIGARPGARGGVLKPKPQRAAVIPAGESAPGPLSRAP